MANLRKEDYSENNMANVGFLEVKKHQTATNNFGDTVTLRSFQRSDQNDCLQIFTDGFEEYIKSIVITALSASLWYVAMATVLVSLAAVVWSTWIFVVFSVIIFVVFVCFCVTLQIARWRYLNYVINHDLKDIEKLYMSHKGCHMWVAEWRGKVVGMVGLIHSKSQEPGVFELQRMYVVPHCRRMGIGKKMLIEVITHAKRHRVKMIVLMTSTTQVAAIKLYMKYGFKLTSERASTNETNHRPDGEQILGMLTNVIQLKLFIYSG